MLVTNFLRRPKGPNFSSPPFFFVRQSSLIALDCTFRKDIPTEHHQQPQDTCKLRRPMQPKVGPPGPILVLEDQGQLGLVSAAAVVRGVQDLCPPIEAVVGLNWPMKHSRGRHQEATIRGQHQGQHLLHQGLWDDGSRATSNLSNLLLGKAIFNLWCRLFFVRRTHYCTN